MSPQRLRAKLRRIREAGEEMAEESGELNLVPYLDIVMNLIMFLLATVTFSATLGNININLPTAAVASPGQEAPKPELNLTVSISDKGFTLATSGAVLYQGFSITDQGVVQTTSELPTLPMGRDDKGQPRLDFAGLSKVLRQIKERYPDEERALLTATPQTPYDLVVQTMDAMREDGKPLFPSVLLLAGVN